MTSRNNYGAARSALGGPGRVGCMTPSYILGIRRAERRLRVPVRCTWDAFCALHLYEQHAFVPMSVSCIEFVV